MSGLQVKYQSILVQDHLKPSVKSKITYMNDVFGNLFSAVQKFQSEKRQLIDLIEILLHFKHQLIVIHENGWSFKDAVNNVGTEFQTDFEECIRKFHNQIEGNGQLFDFIQLRSSTSYLNAKTYQSLQQIGKNDHIINGVLQSSLSNIFNDNESVFDQVQNDLQVKQIKPNKARSNVDLGNYDNEEYQSEEPLSDEETKSMKKIKQKSKLKTAKKQKSQQTTNLQIPMRSLREKIFKSTSETNKTEPRKQIQNSEQCEVTNITETTLPHLDKEDLIVIDFCHGKPPSLTFYYQVNQVKNSHRKQYKCLIPNCNNIFYRGDSIGSHIYKHFRIKPFQCSNCEYSSDLRKGLKKHCRRTHKYSMKLFKYMEYFRGILDETKNQYLYRCNFGRCQFETKHSVVLIGHLNWHLSQHPFKCAYCMKRFPDVDQCKRHLNRAHKRRRAPIAKQLDHQCLHFKNCDFKLEPFDLNSMVEHMKEKHFFSLQIIKDEVKILGTNLPKFSVTDGDIDDGGDDLKDNNDVEQNEDYVANSSDESNDDDDDDDDDDGGGGADDVGFSVLYSCSYKGCRFKSKSQTQVRAHEVRRHVREVLKCTQNNCGQIFDTAANLNEHMLNEHALGSCPCPVEGCNKGFINTKRLNCHLRENHEDFYQTCSFCNRKFDSRDKLRRHVRLLHQKGDYKCRFESCDFRCQLQREMHRHLRKEHRKDKKKCTFEGCNQIVSQYLYKRHMNRHLNIKEHCCSWPECGKSFIDRNNLKHHMRIHLNFKRYQCTWPECGYGSVQRANVKKHIRIKHLKLPYTKKQEREMNIDFDSLPHKPNDFIARLSHDIEI